MNLYNVNFIVNYDDNNQYYYIISQFLYHTIEVL